MLPDLVLEALAVLVGPATADRASQLLESRDDVWEDPEEGWELGISGEIPISLVYLVVTSMPGMHVCCI